MSAVLDIGFGFIEGRQPETAGAYERVSALGITTDMWDGKHWRRRVDPCVGHAVEPSNYGSAPFHGVICSNQRLPWRSIVGHGG